MIGQQGPSSESFRGRVGRDGPRAYTRWVPHRKGSGLRSLAGLVVAVALLLAAACGSPAPEITAVPPDTPAGTQLGWLLTAMADPPISEAQVRAHFNPSFLDVVSPAELNRWLHGGSGAKLVWAKADGPSTVDAIVSAGDTRARGEHGSVATGSLGSWSGGTGS